MCISEKQEYGQGVRLGVLPGVPSHRLLESYFLWIWNKNGTVIRLCGADLEGRPTVLQEPYPNSTLGFA